jgi:hypothetical protein
MKARNYAESYRLRRGSYFIKCDVSKSADKAMVENHSYFWAIDYALTMPVLKEILLPRLIVQRKIGIKPLP